MTDDFCILFSEALGNPRSFRVFAVGVALSPRWSHVPTLESRDSRGSAHTGAKEQESNLFGLVWKILHYLHNCSELVPTFLWELPSTQVHTDKEKGAFIFSKQRQQQTRV